MEASASAVIGSPARRFTAALALAFRRLAWSKFMGGVCLLALLPVALSISIYFFPSLSDDMSSIASVHPIYEGFLFLIHIRFIVFFGASIFGFAVMRQEIDEQTLHYVLLQPIERWMLIVTRFLAYLLISSAICVVSLWLTYLFLVLPRFPVSDVASDLFEEGRFKILVIESLILVLGLLAFGAIALLASTVFKSAFYVLLLLGWEWALPFLPGTLKFLTVTHYMQSLLPEATEQSRPVFELIGEPASVGTSLVVIGVFSAILIGVATAIFQRKECLYGDT